jgi:hypothetical protein
MEIKYFLIDFEIIIIVVFVVVVFRRHTITLRSDGISVTS